MTDKSAMRHSDLTGIGGFQSKLARKIALLALLGFLACLAVIPGWERLSGFLGFFGIFGLAYIVEAIYRRSTANDRHHAEPAGRADAGEADGL